MTNFKHLNASEQIVDGTITASLLAPNASVLSLNSDSNPNLTGNVQLVSGSHITLSQIGQAITVNATGELSTALTTNHIFVGNVSNVATDVSLSGDATIIASGALTLVNTSVAPSSYTNTALTVDSKGRITAASSGVIGNLTESTSSVLVITGGIGSILGTGTSIQVHQANTSVSGYLSNTDWNTFNNKQPSGNYLTTTLSNADIFVGNVSNVATAVSISGDATLSNTGAITLATVNGSSGSTTLSSITTNSKGLVTVNSSATLADTNIWIGNGSSVPTAHVISGDATLADTGVLTLSWATVYSEHFVTRETPSGIINGSNVTFILANIPILGSECLFLNGLLQNAGGSNDYTISGSTITFIVAPKSGSVLLVNYQK